MRFVIRLVLAPVRLLLRERRQFRQAYDYNPDLYRADDPRSSSDRVR